VKADTKNSMADYIRSSDILTEQLLFTTPEEERKQAGIIVVITVSPSSNSVNKFSSNMLWKSYKESKFYRYVQCTHPRTV